MKIKEKHTKSALVIGEVLFDVFSNTKKVLGGAPFNVAWNLKGFGLEPRFCSVVGKDKLGEMIKNSMKDWGLSTEFILTDKKLPTGKVEISFDSGEPIYKIIENCAYDNLVLNDLDFSNISLLYHGSLAFRNKHNYLVLQKIKKNFKGQVFVDINLREPWYTRDSILDFIKNSNYLKLNLEELEIIFGKTIKHQDIYKVGKELKSNYNVSNIIITLGADGSFVIDENENKFVAKKARLQNELVDTVGAGDAFSSVFIFGILNNWTLDVILNRASKFAAKVCSNRGAINYNKDFYKSELEGWI